MKILPVIASLLALSGPAFANGDPVAGEAQFKRQCVSCHVVKNASGEVLAGRNARTGPNLFGLSGATPGNVSGYRYSKSLKAYGESGVVWGADNTAAYLMNPTEFLKTALNDKKARARMSFRVRKEQDAKDIFAYLSQFSAQ